MKLSLCACVVVLCAQCVPCACCWQPILAGCSCSLMACRRGVTAARNLCSSCSVVASQACPNSIAGAAPEDCEDGQPLPNPLGTAVCCQVCCAVACDALASSAG